MAQLSVEKKIELQEAAKRVAAGTPGAPTATNAGDVANIAYAQKAFGWTPPTSDFATKIASPGNNITGGNAVANQEAKVKAQAGDLYEEAGIAEGQVPSVNPMDDPDIKASFDEVNRIRQSLGMTTPEEQQQIEEVGEAAGAEYDPLIREAQIQKEQGMGKATVSAGEVGGFMNTQFAGLAALTPTKGADFAGAGGQLEYIKSAYDTHISQLEQAKMAAINNAKAQAQIALRTGKQEDLDNAQKMFENAQSVWDAQQKAIQDRITAVEKATSIKTQRVKFETDTASAIAPSLVGLDEKGNPIIPKNEDIQAMADAQGIDVNILGGAINKRIDDLNKMTLDQRKAEWDMMTPQTQAYREYAQYEISQGRVPSSPAEYATQSKLQGKILGSATRGYSYIDYVNGRPVLKSLGGVGGGVGGTGTAASEQKMTSYLDAITQVEQAPTLSQEEIDRSGGRISGYTQESKTAVISSVLRQAAASMTTSEFNKFTKVYAMTIASRKYKVAADPVSGKFINLDTGMPLTDDQATKYIENVDKLRSQSASIDALISSLVASSQASTPTTVNIEDTGEVNPNG